jgi:hypothetical protein
MKLAARACGEAAQSLEDLTERRSLSAHRAGKARRFSANLNLLLLRD